MKKIISLIVVSLSLFNARATNDTIILKGTVLDNNTKQGIPSSMVFAMSNGICSGTNVDGCFVLTLPASLRNDKVVFSAFGYHRDTVAVSHLLKNGTVLLTPKPFMLKTVTVVSYTPSGLLDEVVKRIPDNYQTDTTLNHFFFRNYGLANDSIYLFYENIFESLRVGYNKFNNKKRISSSDNSRRLNSNYNHIKMSRLLVYDSIYLSNLLYSGYYAKKQLEYYDNRTITDPMESPNATYVFSKKKRKKYAMQLQELSDSTGKGYYLLTMKGRNQTIQLDIDKQSLAVTHIIIEGDTGTTDFPTSKSYRDVHPYSRQICNLCRCEIQYQPINGKYTLVSEKLDTDYLFYCHNEGPWKKATHEQHFQVSRIIQLIKQDTGGHEFLETNQILEPKPISYSNIPCSDTSYDEAFWDGMNYIPLSEVVKKKMKRH